MATQTQSLSCPQAMFHNWRHTFPLYEGYVRIIFKRVDALGPPPADLNDRVLVRVVQPASQPACDADCELQNLVYDVLEDPQPSSVRDRCMISTRLKPAVQLFKCLLGSAHTAESAI